MPMFSKGLAQKTIEYQQHRSMPLFNAHWYTDQNDQHTRILNFAAIAEIAPQFKQTLNQLPHSFLNAIEKDLEWKRAGNLATDFHGEPMADPVPSIMFNLTKAEQMNRIESTDVVSVSEICDEFFQLTGGEICGLSKTDENEKLLVYLAVDYKDDSVKIERFSPEKKFLFLAFLEDKKLLTEQEIDASNVLLGRGSALYAQAQEKIRAANVLKLAV
jgi:hypothetical protein